MLIIENGKILSFLSSIKTEGITLVNRNMKIMNKGNTKVLTTITEKI